MMWRVRVAGPRTENDPFPLIEVGHVTSTCRTRLRSVTFIPKVEPIRHIGRILASGAIMMDRRSFVRIGGAAAASAFLTKTLGADPYAPLSSRAPATRPIRARGIVRSKGKGLSGVRVSDGIEVVTSDRAGRYELITSTDRDYLTVSPPAGFSVPTNPSGTAAGYVPIQIDRRDEMSVAFDLEPLARSDADHVMLLLPDIQTENGQEMTWFHEQAIPDVLASVREIGETPTFAISCGDIMFDNLSYYPDYEKGIARVGIPFFQAVGNHDLDQENGTDEGSTTTFTQRFGPRYRSFDRGAVHYVILDDVFWHGSGYLGYLEETQLRWLANDLKFVEPGRPIIVATHIPVLGTGHIRRGEQRPGLGVSVANRDMLYRLLEPYRAHIVCGHTHENDHNWHQGIHEHVSGTVCGAWWSGPICADGTPNGYGVYEVRGEDVKWRYKATGFDRSHQIRTYRRGADPRSPDEIVANVWDWNPSWNVVWYENGERRGQMARRVGLDPLSVELHTGPDLPPRRTWVEPYPTQHLFYAPASPDARDIRVEATDGSGATYSTGVPLK
jgi:C terminal of Calcineurin-like phosphoesterase/N terminal of Calcineurin-like phosphoesterase/Calcineurin-like phosphoesterase